MPILKGDLKYPKRGPKREPKTRVVQKIEKRLHVKIFQKLNLDEEKTMSVLAALAALCLPR